MNIVKALETLKRKINKYNTLSKEYADLEDKHNSEVKRVKEMYSAKKRGEVVRHLLAMKDIAAEEKEAMDNIPKTNFDHAELTYAYQDEKYFRKELLENFIIDHNLMCQLLEKETNMAWTFKEVSGRFQSDLKYKFDYAYGVVLINEKKPEFHAEGKIHYAEYLKKSENIIPCCLGLTYPQSFSDECQIEANNYNWLDFYLHSVGLVPEYENGEDAKKDLPKCGKYEDAIRNAIAKYIQSFSPSDISENDMEESQA